MNWKFWQKENIDVAELDDQDLDEETHDDEDTDDLSDLDPELKERFEKHLTKERTRYEGVLSQARQGLQQVGLDLSDDNSVTIRDTQKITGYLAPLFQQQQQNVQKPVANDDDDNEEDAWADPVVERDKFKQKLDKEIKNATAPYLEQIKKLESSIIEDKIEDAVNKVGDAVQKYAPLLSSAVEHPEFEPAFRDALSRLPMEQWRDSRNLVRVAAMLVPDLSPIEKPERMPRRENELARSAANRDTLRQISPSRQSTTTKQEKDGSRYTDLDRILAERMGISVEMSASLGKNKNSDDGEDPFAEYRTVRAKEQQQRKRV